MPKPRDISTDQDWTTFRDPSLRDAHANPEREFRVAATNEQSTTDRHPTTPLQALMQAAPGDEPEISAAEIQPLREAVADAIDRLTPESRFIIEAIHFERLHYSQLARRLGVSKTHAYRLSLAAEAELKAQLMTDPTIRRRIMTTPTWNDAAHARVVALAPTGASISDTAARSLIDRKIAAVRRDVREGVFGLDILAPPLTTIGLAAAVMLDHRGLWDIEEMTALLCRKQHDYGHDNINAFGIVGVAVRCSDKVARFNNLTDKNSTGTAEPLEDALLDMVGYAVIAQMLLDDVFNLELA